MLCGWVYCSLLIFKCTVTSQKLIILSSKLKIVLTDDIAECSLGFTNKISISEVWRCEILVLT